MTGEYEGSSKEKANSIKSITLWQLSNPALSQRGAYLLKSGLWSDCTFLVGVAPFQTFIPAHKIYLASASSVFEEMLSPDFYRPCPLFLVSDVPTVIFRNVLEFIYTDNLVITSMKQAYDVCYAAKKYALPALVKIGLHFIEYNMDASNVVELFEFASSFNITTLMDKCLKMINQCTNDLMVESSLDTAALYMDGSSITNTQLKTSFLHNNNIISQSILTAEIEESHRELIGETGLIVNLSIHNISYLSRVVPSSEFIIRKIPWRFEFSVEETPGVNSVPVRYLAVTVRCILETKSNWRCDARALLKLVNQKGADLAYSRQIIHTFQENDNFCGYSAFMPMYIILDKNKGFFNDDSIEFQITLMTDTPKGLPKEKAKRRSRKRKGFKNH